MTLKQAQYDVGVIVGRFQVPGLHDAHTSLIQAVCDKHDKVVIFLGLSPLITTQNNPLDFEARKQMILDKFPRVNVLYIKDVHDDGLWSRRLDEMIRDITTPSQTVLLYGGRDSFIHHYTGNLPTAELEQDVFVSGTEVRKNVSRKSVKASYDFRAGVVWAAYNRFPTSFPTVDVIVYNEDRDSILLGRKEFEREYRIIGGFADPGSPSYEADARREVSEEAGIEITDPKYIGSTVVDDWRYRHETDKIKTLLFEAKHKFGQPKAADDLSEVRWFKISDIKETDVVHTHRPLLKMAGIL